MLSEHIPRCLLLALQRDSRATFKMVRIVRASHGLPTPWVGPGFFHASAFRWEAAATEWICLYTDTKLRAFILSVTYRRHFTVAPFSQRDVT